jgi:hypothetical protein
MINLKYISERGAQMVFSLANGLVINTVDGFTDCDVDIATSQGFGQIGETVTNVSVKGKKLDVEGRIFGEGTALKRQLLNTVVPLESGVLWLNDKYWIGVCVQSSPNIQQKANALFTFRLYAPFPFWRAASETYYQLGGIIPAFSFPLDLSAAFTFGSRAADTFVNCINRGNVKVAFRLDITGTEEIVNPKITNIYTFEETSFTVTLAVGQKLSMYREGDILRVTMTENGVETDVFDVLGEDSNLFWLYVGDNVLRGDADSGLSTATFVVTLWPTYAGAFYDM